MTVFGASKDQTREGDLWLDVACHDLWWAWPAFGTKTLLCMKAHRQLFRWI